MIIRGLGLAKCQAEEGTKSGNKNLMERIAGCHWIWSQDPREKLGIGPLGVDRPDFAARDEVQSI